MESKRTVLSAKEWGIRFIVKTSNIYPSHKYIFSTGNLFTWLKISIIRTTENRSHRKHINESEFGIACHIPIEPQKSIASNGEPSTVWENVQEHLGRWFERSSWRCFVQELIACKRRTKINSCKWKVWKSRRLPLI